VADKREIKHDFGRIVQRGGGGRVIDAVDRPSDRYCCGAGRLNGLVEIEFRRGAKAEQWDGDIH
jgi:hypothetical protein